MGDWLLQRGVKTSIQEIYSDATCWKICRNFSRNKVDTTANCYNPNRKFHYIFNVALPKKDHTHSTSPFSADYKLPLCIVPKLMLNNFLMQKLCNDFNCAVCCAVSLFHWMTFIGNFHFRFFTPRHNAIIPLENQVKCNFFDKLRTTMKSLSGLNFMR